jgi:hypothetical protein
MVEGRRKITQLKLLDIALWPQTLYQLRQGKGAAARETVTYDGVRHIYRDILLL